MKYFAALEEQFSQRLFLTDTAGQPQSVVIPYDEFQTFLRAVSKLMESFGEGSETIIFPHQAPKSEAIETTAVESTTHEISAPEEYTLEQKISSMTNCKKCSKTRCNAANIKINWIANYTPNVSFLS